MADKSGPPPAYAYQTPGKQEPPPSYGNPQVQPYPGQGYPQGPGYSQAPVYGYSQPPGPGYLPPATQQQQQSTNVVINGGGVRTVGGPMCFGHNPTATVCPHCSQSVVTTVDYEVGSGAWTWFFIFFIVGFWVLITWFICCIPFCINSMKDARHSCPNCHHTVGFHRSWS